ncbi:MAG: tRNA 2-thiouridine(34) synthase MnmA [Piscirickettsiaceae bacterium]|nr:tRNA 2-thiouridine(34) synthase MnmA [Piscirickettsiaceae bacterium]
MSRNKIVVGLSGGVDSSVAALLLSQQCFDVEGIFMKNWINFAEENECTIRQDKEDADSVAKILNIPIQEANFAMKYWDLVFKNFLDEYRAGRTPNPDILCNREIKFKAFLNHAIQLGCDMIATGHYARIKNYQGVFYLLKGFDYDKDQSYFLYTLGQKQLARILFPLGQLSKLKVRLIAKEAGFITHNKKDSTGICFIGKRDFRKFISQYIPVNHGQMQTPEGEIICEHVGLTYYTLGQRQGLGIGGRKYGTGKPWFVAGKDMKNNILYVIQGDHSWLYSKNLQAEKLTWISGKAPKFPCAAKAKTRYRQTDQKCIITSINDNRIHVKFEDPQRAVTPGQSVVFYHDDTCLGGGVIMSTDAPGIHP